MKHFLILMRPLWSEMLANTSRGMGSISSRKKNKDKPRSRASTVLLFTFIIVMFSFYSVMIGIGLTKALMVVGAEDLFIRIIAMAAPIFTPRHRRLAGDPDSLPREQPRITPRASRQTFDDYRPPN